MASRLKLRRAEIALSESKRQSSTLSTISPACDNVDLDADDETSIGKLTTGGVQSDHRLTTTGTINNR